MHTLSRTSTSIRTAHTNSPSWTYICAHTHTHTHTTLTYAHTQNIQHTNTHNYNTHTHIHTHTSELRAQQAKPQQWSRQWVPSIPSHIHTSTQTHITTTHTHTHTHIPRSFELDRQSRSSDRASGCRESAIEHSPLHFIGLLEMSKNGIRHESLLYRCN